MSLKNRAYHDEKNSLFFTASVVGAAFLCIYFLTGILNRIIALVYRACPQFWAYDNGAVADSAVYVFYAVIGFALPAILFSKLTKTKIYESVGFGKARKGTAVPVFLAAVGLIPLANVINTFIVDLFRSHNLNPSDGITITAPQTLGGMVLYVLHISVIPALCEELLCRAFVFGSMRRFGEHTAAIFSAVIFGLFHKNFEQIPFAFILGLVFAYTIALTGSVWVAVAVHFFNNFASCVLEMIGHSISNEVYTLISGIYMMSLAVMGVVGVIWITVKISNYSLTIPKYKGSIPAFERTAIIWSSPTVLAFVGIMIYIAVENMM